MSMVEAPRGESVHYVITGEENRPTAGACAPRPIRTCRACPVMLLNNQFADFPIIVGSIDPCFSCTDRVAVLDGRSGVGRVLDRARTRTSVPSRTRRRG